jgi:hypothetical protein
MSDIWDALFVLEWIRIVGKMLRLAEQGVCGCEVPSVDEGVCMIQ